MSLLPHRLLFAATCFCLTTSLQAARADEPTKAKLEFRRAETKPADGLTVAMVPGHTDKIYLHKAAELTEEDIAAVAAGIDQRLNPCIDITFTKKGAEKMEKLSESQMDKPIAILVEGKVISAPIVKSKLSGQAQITGVFTTEEVEQLVKAIKAK